MKRATLIKAKLYIKYISIAILVVVFVWSFSYATGSIEPYKAIFIALSSIVSAMLILHTTYKDRQTIKVLTEKKRECTQANRRKQNV